MKTNQ